MFHFAFYSLNPLTQIFGVFWTRFLQVEQLKFLLDIDYVILIKNTIINEEAIEYENDSKVDAALL